MTRTGTRNAFFLTDPAKLAPAVENLSNALHCKVNRHTLYLLLQDDPAKRRKVYLEFRRACQQQILMELEHAGFDMETLRRQKTVPLAVPTPEEGFSCLITGTVDTILKFLPNNTKVFLASVDFPEFSWLSASSPDFMEHPGASFFEN